VQHPSKPPEKVYIRFIKNCNGQTGTMFSMVKSFKWSGHRKEKWSSGGITRFPEERRTKEENLIVDALGF
jgi:hypothetical protein